MLNITPRAKRVRFLPWIIIAIMILFLFLLTPHGSKNILLVGIDQYGSLSDSGRSDAILLVHLDYGQGKISVISFARDILFEYNGSARKINTIVRTSTEESLVHVLEDNFDLPIDGWFRVNFSSFVSLVDAIGGVDLELTAKEASYITRQVGIYPEEPLQEGSCHINGAQALAYARCRQLDNDFARNRRQSKLIEALIAKSRDMSIQEVISFFREMEHAWRSSYSTSEQFQLLLSCIPLRNAEIEQIGIPFDGLYRYGTDSGGGSAVILNHDQNKNTLHDILSQ